MSNTNEFYIISLKHTSKGDAALTFWGADGKGYTWHQARAGIYTEASAKKHIDLYNAAVDKQHVDAYWRDAIDHGDLYISIPNTDRVRKALGLSTKLLDKGRGNCRVSFVHGEAVRRIRNERDQLTEELKRLKERADKMEDAMENIMDFIAESKGSSSSIESRLTAINNTLYKALASWKEDQTKERI